jgi:hypothetical protein
MTDPPPVTDPPADEAAAKAAADKAAADAQAAGSTPAATQSAASTAASTAAPNMSDADIERIAQRSAAIQVSEFEKRGAFETAPPAATAGTDPPADGDGAPGDGDDDENGEQKPKKRTWAEKFAGVNK